MTILISVAELADELAAESDASLRILDVRWSLGGPPGRPLYAASHIPSAVYVDLDTELAGPAAPREGRHPLPSIEALTAAARGWGLEDGDRVVVYDDAGGQFAARAWWLLRHAGVADVRILDGGLAAWREASHPLEAGQSEQGRGMIALSYGHMSTLTQEEAAVLPVTGILLDARAAERYRGEVEPVDPRPGHIPGALSAPTADNLDAADRFLAADQLAARFERLGVTADTSIGVYCGSGVTAAHEVAALAIAGIDAALYAGSYSQWSNQQERDVVTGNTP